MFALYSNIPKGIKVNNILHVVDTNIYHKLKNTITQDFIYTRMAIFKPGLTIMKPNILKEYSTIVVHDTPNRTKFWMAIKSEKALCTRLLQLIKSKTGVYIGIGYGGELIQDVSSEIKDHYSPLTILSIPLLGGLNKRILLNYKRYKTTRLELLNRSRNDTFYCFPPNTGYDSNTKGIIGNGIYMYRDGSEYYVTPNTTKSDHRHYNTDILDNLTEIEGRLVYNGMAPILTWESIQW